MTRSAKVDRQHVAQMTVREVHDQLVSALESGDLTMSASYSLDYAEDLMDALDEELAEHRAGVNRAI